jgi:hypothetical protein
VELSAMVAIPVLFSMAEPASWKNKLDFNFFFFWRNWNVSLVFSMAEPASWKKN